MTRNRKRKSSGGLPASITLSRGRSDLKRSPKDIVLHFVGRGYRGKAMMICIDKATAVSMYDRVQRHWKENIVELKAAAYKDRRRRT